MRFAALSSLLKVNGEDIVGVRALNPLAFDGFEQLLHKHFMRIFSKFPNENVTEPGKIYFTPNHASTSPKQPPFASPLSLTHTHTQVIRFHSFQNLREPFGYLLKKLLK